MFHPTVISVRPYSFTSFIKLIITFTVVTWRIIQHRKHQHGPSEVQSQSYENSLWPLICTKTAKHQSMRVYMMCISSLGLGKSILSVICGDAWMALIISVHNNMRAKVLNFLDYMPIDSLYSTTKDYKSQGNKLIVNIQKRCHLYKATVSRNTTYSLWFITTRKCLNKQQLTLAARLCARTLFGNCHFTLLDSVPNYLSKKMNDGILIFNPNYEG